MVITREMVEADIKIAESNLAKVQTNAETHIENAKREAFMAVGNAEGVLKALQGQLAFFDKNRPTLVPPEKDEAKEVQGIAV